MDESTHGPGGERRVLLVTGAATGGLAGHVEQLADGLPRAGWQVRLAAPPAVLARPALAGCGDTVVVDIAERPDPRRDLATLRRLRAAARGSDVVHAHGVRAGALAILAAGGVPVVVTLHNAAPVAGPARAVFLALAALVARRGTTVLTVSPDLAALAHRLGARQVAEAVVAAVPAPPPDPAQVRAVRARLGDPPVLAVTVGRLAAQKDLDTALSALARVPARLGVLLAVAGDGPLRAHLQQRIDAERLPAVLLGRRDDVPALLAAADVVVSSARWEGRPLWLQEALRAGAPVVATDAGGTAGVLDGAGELVPVGDAATLAAAVIALAGDPRRRAELAAAARRRAAALPDPVTAVEAAAAAYRAALTAAASPSSRRPA